MRELANIRLTDRADARGHYTIGKELVDNVIDRIRRVAGKANLQIFPIALLIQL